MNKFYAAVIGVLVLVAGIYVGSLYAVNNASQVGGDFPGGIVPSQLFSANSGTNSVSPISGLPNLLVPGSISAGGTSANNQVTVVYTATTAYPAMAFNLGAITQAT